MALMIALTLGSLTPLPTASSLVTASTAFSSAGTITYPSGPTLPSINSPINKAVSAYTSGWLTTTQINFIAQHFTLLNTNFGLPSSQMQALHNANPNLKVLGYKDLIAMHSDGIDPDWSIVNTHETWFMHDTYGNRIFYSPFNWWLMDPANPEWQAYFVNDALAKISASGYDGIFIDDVWNDVTFYCHNLPTTNAQTWHNDVVAFLRYIKANLPGKIVVVNTDEWYGSTYINEVDGAMMEGFAHAEWCAANDEGGRGSTFNLNLVGKLAADSANGKIVWAASGVIPSTQAEDDRLLKYCYAEFLLGANGATSYFGFNSWYSSDGAKGYYSIMDTPVGSPTGAYYKSQNVYMRDFTGAKVLFNPYSTAYTINLGRTYRTLNGATVSSITLNAYSAEILLP